MKLLRHWQQLQQLPPSVVTIGNFDGVHCGHQAIVRRVCAIAKERQLASVVMFFEPQPQELFLGANAPARLMHWRDKVEALRELGVDYVLMIRFDRVFRGLSAQAFIEKVLLALHCKHLVVGDDFRYGCDRSGDFGLLQQAGQQHGFVVENTPTITDAEHERISSTRIRAAVKAGDFALVKKLSGRPYCISGHVRHGDKIGRTLDFPTANIALQRQVVALSGIYTVKVWGLTSDQPLLGAANVGTRPAVNGTDNRLEVHILDFKGDIYGRRIRVQFCKKLRDETNFPSLEALKQAIAADVVATREYFQIEAAPDKSASQTQ